MANPFTPEEVSQILEAFFAAVGTRQYIGARYVPLLGRKGEDSIVWDNSAPYEPLTIVLYQGNSFTSRQYVPAGVEITNTDFWAATGNYNAQIEQYRLDTLAALQTAQDAQTDIDQLLPKASFSAENTVKDYIDAGVSESKQYTDTQIETLSSVLPSTDFDSTNTVKEYIDNNVENIKDQVQKQKKAIFIGNSYTEGVGSTSGTDGMYNRLKHLFGEAFMFTGGGFGFGTYENHDNTFIDLLNNAIANSQFENSEITDIFFFSAMGDTRSLCEGNENVVRTNIQTCMNLCKTNFPNATVYVGYCELVYGRTTQGSYSNKYYAYQHRMHFVFGQLHEMLEFVYLGWLGWNRNNTNNVNAGDGYHPNDNGYNSLVSAFLNAYHGINPYIRKSTVIDTYLNVVALNPIDMILYLPNIPRDKFNGSITAGTKIKLYDIVTSSSLPSIIPNLGLPQTIFIRNTATSVFYASLSIDIDSDGNMGLYIQPYETITDIATTGTMLNQNILELHGIYSASGNPALR